MRPLTLAAGLALFLLSGCGDPTAPADVTGTWGGPDANLTLTRAGGTVEYGCGAGTISGSWTLSPDGHWTATGQHFTGGGPAPVGGHPPHPAQYAGTVRGRFLTFVVSLPDIEDTLGPFTVERGRTVPLNLCL